MWKVANEAVLQDELVLSTRAALFLLCEWASLLLLKASRERARAALVQLLGCVGEAHPPQTVWSAISRVDPPRGCRACADVALGPRCKHLAKAHDMACCAPAPSWCAVVQILQYCMSCAPGCDQCVGFLAGVFRS